MSEYGNGRINVIDECLEWAGKQYEQLSRVEAKEENNIHKKAMLGGKKKAYSEFREYLILKMRNVK